MKLLVVGDLHVQKTNLEESSRLLDWIIVTAKAHRISNIWFLGDIYNDFAVKRVEVEEFWVSKFNSATAQGINSLVITGNHDLDSTGAHSALTCHKSQATVISYPLSAFGVGFVPFVRNNEVFLEAVNRLYAEGVRTIFCHAEFDGCQFENGMYAPHGIKTDSLPSGLKLISGHIHKCQEFGNVWYPGTPRQLTRSDIGQTKGVWIYDTEDGTREFLATPENVCKSFRSFVLTEENVDEISQMMKDADGRVYLDVKGSKDFIKSVLGSVPEQVKVRTLPTDKSTEVRISESEGLSVAFRKYSEAYFDAENLNPDKTQKILNKVFERCGGLKI